MWFINLFPHGDLKNIPTKSKLTGITILVGAFGPHNVVNTRHTNTHTHKTHAHTHTRTHTHTHTHTYTHPLCLHQRKLWQRSERYMLLLKKYLSVKNTFIWLKYILMYAINNETQWNMLLKLKIYLVSMFIWISGARKYSSLHIYI